jgi:hypothetical protein
MPSICHYGTVRPAPTIEQSTVAIFITLTLKKTNIKLTVVSLKANVIPIKKNRKL